MGGELGLVALNPAKVQNAHPFFIERVDASKVFRRAVGGVANQVAGVFF